MSMQSTRNSVTKPSSNWDRKSRSSTSQPLMVAESNYGKDSDSSSVLAAKKRGFLKIPLLVLMATYIATSVVVVGVIGWKFTYDSANKNLERLAEQIQERVAGETLSSIIENARVITQITAYQREMYRSNQWSFITPERQTQTRRAMLALLKQVRPWTVDIYYNVYPEGTLFGYYYSGNQNDWTLRNWEQFGDTTISNICYDNGTSMSEDWRVTDPASNLTITYEAWYNGNFSISSDQILGPVYPWNNVAWKTSLATVTNPVTNEQYFIGNDWTLTFIGRKFESLLAAIPYPMFMAAVETATASLIATSTNIDLLTSDGSAILTFDSTNDTFLNDFTNWIRSSQPGDTSVSRITNLLQTITKKGPITVNRYVNGSNFNVRLEMVNVPWDSPWLSIQYLNMDAVFAPMRADSKVTEITIFCIMGAVVIVGTIFAWVISRQVELVVKQIIILKSMKFQEVLEKEKGIRHSSFVKELSDLQTSFFEMVVAFASHLKVRNSITGTAGFGGATSQSRRESYVSQSQSTAATENKSRGADVNLLSTTYVD
ncbi:hypothetical protein HDU76_005959 [Blyttiomyces sp. JEL0837]|nr:hypothetical protein HDU76_005959 [Blyttiomyces sp. JEL0837]